MKPIIMPHSKGMTLLEVLVSLVLLAIGMLGLASMLLIANQSNNSSYARQQAIQTVYNIFDKIRANSQAAINGNYNISNIGTNGTPATVSTPGVLCNTSSCTPAQLANFDTFVWLTQNVAQLPNGSGSISTALSPVAGNTVVTVTVQWDDSTAQNLLGSSGAAGTNPNYVQISIQSQI